MNMNHFPGLPRLEKTQFTEPSCPALDKTVEEAVESSIILKVVYNRLKTYLIIFELIKKKKESRLRI